MSAARRLARLFLLLALLGVALALFAMDRLKHPPPASGPPAEVTVFVPPGTSTGEIFRRLAAEGIVENAPLAEAYYRLLRSATPLQAGEYRFRRPMPIDELIGRMGRGDVVRHTVVVPEGLTAEEVFPLFTVRGIGTIEGFRAAFRETDLLPGIARGVPDLQGFLFPDTYQVTRSTPARQIVGWMVRQFRTNFSGELREKAIALGLAPRQAVTLASIVEKETALPREAPMIAGVYLNRLRRGMRLQADPTVVYALKHDGKWTGTLYRSDYAYESPYNTYLYQGLPPGPICNPGLAALKAAVSPVKTDFLYFVADANGGHTFSRTFEEHLQAIAASRRFKAEATPAAGEPAPSRVKPGGAR